MRRLVKFHGHIQITEERQQLWIPVSQYIFETLGRFIELKASCPISYCFAPVRHISCRFALNACRLRLGEGALVANSLPLCVTLASCGQSTLALRRQPFRATPRRDAIDPSAGLPHVPRSPSWRLRTPRHSCRSNRPLRHVVSRDIRLFVWKSAVGVNGKYGENTKKLWTCGV